jgi:hypothetical protein
LTRWSNYAHDINGLRTALNQIILLFIVRIQESDMTDLEKQLRDAQREAHTLAVHTEDPAAKIRAQRIERSLKKIAAQMFPKPPSKGYDWAASL